MLVVELYFCKSGLVLHSNHCAYLCIYREIDMLSAEREDVFLQMFSFFFIRVVLGIALIQTKQ